MDNIKYGNTQSNNTPTSPNTENIKSIPNEDRRRVTQIEYNINTKSLIISYEE